MLDPHAIFKKGKFANTQIMLCREISFFLVSDEETEVQKLKKRRRWGRGSSKSSQQTSRWIS